MNDRIELLVERVLAPLDDGVGADLAAGNAPELTQIRDQFSQSIRDLPALFDLGEEILTRKSKDLWALWALVGGVLWSDSYPPDDSLTASCQIASELCRRYWKKIHPTSLGLRNTLLANVVKWWNLYLSRNAAQVEAETLRRCARELQNLSAFLTGQVGADEKDAVRKFPMLTGLAELSEAMIGFASRPQGTPAAPTPVDETIVRQPPSQPAPAHDWWESDESGEFEAPKADDWEPAAAAPGEAEPPAERKAAESALPQAFAAALREIEAGNAAAALPNFARFVNGQRRFADKIRGMVRLGELHLRAGDARQARRILEYAHRQIEQVRLSDWEPELCARLWTNLSESLSESSPEDDPLHADLHVRLQRLDPNLAARLDRFPLK